MVGRDTRGAAGDVTASLRRDGYAFLSGFFDRGEVLRVRAALLQLAAAGQWLAAGSEPFDGRAAAVPVDPDEGERFDRVHRRVQGCQRFHELGQSPRLSGLAEGVLGAPAFCVPQKVARFQFPAAAGSQTEPHQDFPLVQGSPDMLTAWIPLGDYGAWQGRLLVLAGSHRLGPVLSDDGPIGAAERALEWQTTDYRAGDLVLFHGFTVHAAEENRSPRLRVSMDCRLQPVADAVSSLSLEPPDPTLSWDALYQGWTSDRAQWYWRELPLRVRRPSDDPDEVRRRAAASQLVPPGARCHRRAGVATG